MGSWDETGGESGGIGVLDPPRRPRPVRRRRDSGGLERDSGGGRHDGGDPGGGGGGGGGGGHGPGEPERSGEGGGPVEDGRAEFAFAFLLLAVVTLFTVFLGAYLVLRRNAPDWAPEDLPIPPAGLWVSTLVIVSSSVTLLRAARSRRADRGLESRRWLLATIVLGGGFLVAQWLLWRRLVDAGLDPSTNAYGTIFYALTGLHFMHIVGGLMYLGVVWRRPLAVWREPRHPDRSIRFSSLYWHLLTGIWMVLFVLLYFGV